jgi:prolyl oligopeptidase
VYQVSHGWASTDVYFRDMRQPLPSAAPAGAATDGLEFRPLVVGRGSSFDVTAYRDRFYALTDDGAPRRRLLAIDPAHPEPAAWREIVPERADATLEDLRVVGGRLALSYVVDATSRIEIRELDGKPVREVTLPGIGSASTPEGNEDEDEAYYSFSSFTVPRETYAMSVATGATSLWHRLTVPVDPRPYTTEQVFFRSKDGTRVPMFVIRRKDAPRDGGAPTILTGYGGFNVAFTPGFDASIYPWLERGGTYVVANLRGGSEYGEDWHEAGMKVRKQNVFDDFLAAAECLIRERYTSPGRLALKGRSNGGLLVGAALTQRPELFRAVLCGVPLLDMVRYHLFGSGRTWIAEYGSAEDPEEFRALNAYSPYHRLRTGTRSPSVLLLSADTDDRVDPMHARKFAAALQHASTGGPVLLRIERNAGHGGADLLRAFVEQATDEYSFLLAELGG